MNLILVLFATKTIVLFMLPGIFDMYLVEVIWSLHVFEYIEKVWKENVFSKRRCLSGIFDRKKSDDDFTKTGNISAGGNNNWLSYEFNWQKKLWKNNDNHGRIMNYEWLYSREIFLVFVLEWLHQNALKEKVFIKYF